MNDQLTVYEEILKIISTLREQGWKMAKTTEYYYTCVAKFFKDRGYNQFSMEVLEDYWENLEDRYQNDKLTWVYIRRLKKASINYLQFHETGTTQWHYENKPTILSKDFTKAINEYLSTMIFKERSIKTKTNRLKQYFLFMQNKGYKSLKEISVNDIKSFLLMYSLKVNKVTFYNVYREIKQFHIFLEKAELFPSAFSEVFAIPVVQDKKILSAISDNDLEAMLSKINRTTAIGMRDFAIFQLIMTTGLRAIDVTNLQFDCIDWLKNEIHITQSKTGKLLELPLLDEAKKAIREYIDSGRPKSESKNVFLRHCPPFEKLSFLNGIFTRYFDLAGLTLKPNQQKGFHSIRRKLGKDLVTSGVPIETVAQIFGHSSIDSSIPYINLDSEHLKECALSFSGIEIAPGGFYNE